MLHCFNFRGWNETMLFHKEECKLQRTHRTPHYRTSCTPTWGLCFYIYIYIYIDSSISHAMKQCCFIKRSANCKNSYKAPHCWTSCTLTWGLYFYIYIYILIPRSLMPFVLASIPLHLESAHCNASQDHQVLWPRTIDDLCTRYIEIVN